MQRLILYGQGEPGPGLQGLLDKGELSPTAAGYALSQGVDPDEDGWAVEVNTSFEEVMAKAGDDRSLLGFVDKEMVKP